MLNTMSQRQKLLVYSLMGILVIGVGYLYYANIKLKKQLQDITVMSDLKIREEVSKQVINQFRYGTTTAPYQNLGTVYPVIIASTTPILNTNYLIPVTASSGAAYSLSKQQEYLKLREDAIGCFYRESNINERIQLTRSVSYTQFVEGFSRYVPVYGSYEVSDVRDVITLIPNDDSKQYLDIDNRGEVVTLKTSKGVVYKKGACSDFYQN